MPTVWKSPGIPKNRNGWCGIVSGEEVLRRHLKLSSNSDEQALLVAALKTVKDEGYEADASTVIIQKSSTAV